MQEEGHGLSNYDCQASKWVIFKLDFSSESQRFSTFSSHRFSHTFNELSISRFDLRFSTEEILFVQNHFFQARFWPERKDGTNISIIIQTWNEDSDLAGHATM